jgi:hypothetical protein
MVDSKVDSKVVHLVDSKVDQKVEKLVVPMDFLLVDYLVVLKVVN